MATPLERPYPARMDTTHRVATVALPVREVDVRVVDGVDKGRAAKHTERVSIGSAATNDLVLGDRAVSRFHAEMQIAPSGILVVDHGSRNGTYVGAVRLQSAVVPPGTKIRVGDTTLQVGEGGIDSVAVASHDAFGAFRGWSAAARRLMAEAHKAAPSGASVLVIGESGTGKELLARAMHEHGPRPKGPFEVVDGGALVPNLVASELFGHERGAFTGADKRHIGAFERAAGGTLFLDEVGELSQEIQPMLLGALERRRFRRLGGAQDIPLDVRLVAATHRDLRQSINEGRFRLDLYYRIAVVTLRVPSLRERIEDVVPLVVEIATKLGADPTRINDLVSGEARRSLEAHRWPGNVRELRNVVEATLAMGELPSLFAVPETGATVNPLQEGIERLLPLPYGDARNQLVSAFEKRYLEALLQRTQGNVAAAARTAQMDRSHLIDMLKRHGLR